MMFLVTILTFTLQTASTATLPATPQGKQLQAFVKALSAGEAAFVQYQEANMVQKRSLDDRKAMYAKIRKGFGDFKILSVLSASAEKIAVAVTPAEGLDATFTFSFEKEAPFRITEIDVQVQG